MSDDTNDLLGCFAWMAVLALASVGFIGGSIALVSPYIPIDAYRVTARAETPVHTAEGRAIRYQIKLHGTNGWRVWMDWVEVDAATYERFAVGDVVAAEVVDELTK